jgi:N-acyl-D-amino-acid deacylase
VSESFLSRNLPAFVLAAVATLAGGAAPPAQPAAARYDVIIRNGTLYDGSGTPARRAAAAIAGDRVAATGDLASASASLEIDARGNAVAPGFINVLSWATESLLVDGRGMSDLKQGVTLLIFGEGESGGPLTEAMKADLRRRQRDYTYEIDWTTLGEYLDAMVRRGVSPNVASFVGATTVRMHVLGEDDRDPTPAELARMQDLVRQACARARSASAARSSLRRVRRDASSWRSRRRRPSRAAATSARAQRGHRLVRAIDSWWNHEGRGRARRGVPPQGGRAGQLGQMAAGSRASSRRGPPGCL